jgi:hypothetical protein
LALDSRQEATFGADYDHPRTRTSRIILLRICFDAKRVVALSRRSAAIRIRAGYGTRYARLAAHQPAVARRRLGTIRYTPRNESVIQGACT